jgi:hypothetical protein
LVLSSSLLHHIPLLDGHLHREKKGLQTYGQIEKNGTKLQTRRTKTMAWKDTSDARAIVLDLMIKEMAKNKDKIPSRLVEPLNIISMFSSDIDSKVLVIVRLY